MKQMTSRELERSLQREATGTPPRDADSFWRDFRSLAPYRRREAPGPSVRFPLLALLNPPRWALAAAALIIVFLAVGQFLVPAEAPEHFSRIESLEILAPHTAVVIIDDEATLSTLMWVVDMKMNGRSGGTT